MRVIESKNALCPITQRDIDEAMPRLAHGDLPGDIFKALETESCLFCFEAPNPSTQYRLLPCHHIFHLECVDRWLTDRDASCPLCRARFYHLARCAICQHHLNENDNYDRNGGWNESASSSSSSSSSRSRHHQQLQPPAGHGKKKIVYILKRLGEWAEKYS
ncbi:MAG: hypothetical protein M1834_007431 [Cirrosporium novae-zelandiae]|nr:MAG: hypothetical protein M1834_007431 [Cirrosporium novae-zelandiae]